METSYNNNTNNCLFVDESKSINYSVNPNSLIIGSALNSITHNIEKSKYEQLEKFIRYNFYKDTVKTSSYSKQIGQSIFIPRTILFSINDMIVSIPLVLFFGLKILSPKEATINFKLNQSLLLKNEINGNFSTYTNQNLDKDVSFEIKLETLGSDVHGNIINKHLSTQIYSSTLNSN